MTVELQHTIFQTASPHGLEAHGNMLPWHRGTHLQRIGRLKLQVEIPWFRVPQHTVVNLKLQKLRAGMWIGGR